MRNIISKWTMYRTVLYSVGTLLRLHAITSDWTLYSVWRQSLHRHDVWDDLTWSWTFMYSSLFSHRHGVVDNDLTSDSTFEYCAILSTDTMLVSISVDIRTTMFSLPVTCEQRGGDGWGGEGGRGGVSIYRHISWIHCSFIDAAPSISSCSILYDAKERKCQLDLFVVSLIAFRLCKCWHLPQPDEN